MQFRFMMFLAFACGLHAAFASPITFNAYAQIGNGGLLTGTVSIDPVTGKVHGADLTATVNQVFTFNTLVDGTPNYANTGLFVISAYHRSGFPVALVGLQEQNLEKYEGGSISSGSGVIFENLERFGIENASFTQLTNVYNGTHYIGDFQASGTVAGNPFEGTVTINRSTGQVLSSTLTATIRRTYRLNINVTGTPNYGNTGLFVIGAGNAPTGLPLALLGLQTADLIGYRGGVIASGSGFFTDPDTRYAITGGTLSPVPEPSTIAVIPIAAGMLFAVRRRGRSYQR